MRWCRTCTALLALPLLPALSAADEALSRPEVVKLAKPATVLVEARPACGSGFCIHPSGFFITNEHVVRDVPQGSTVTLVLDAGLKTQQMLKAGIVRRDRQLDLALLRAEGEYRLPALALGSDEGLVELTELVAFGFPFGTVLAKAGEYPAMSINVGHVSSLRRDAARDLDRIQLDAVLNPGNSGGPVVDGGGKVVGVVVSGIRGTGINMAIPVTHVRRFLARPEIAFTAPVIGSDRKHEPVEFKVTAFALASPASPLGLELILANAGGPERRFEMKAAGDSYSVKVVPFPDAEDTKALRLEVKYLDGSVVGTAQDRTIRVGQEPVRLRDVCQLRGGVTAEVLLNSGKRLTGAVADLDSLTVKVGGNSLPLKLAGAAEVDVAQIEKPNSVNCTVIARQAGKEVGRQEMRLSVSEALDTNAHVPTSDLKALAGGWAMDRMEVEGRTVVEGDRWSARFDGADYVLSFDGRPQTSARITLDPTQNPKAIDIQWTSGRSSGGTSLGIYRFTADGALEICWNQARGKGSDKRPKVFTTKVELGAGSVLYVYRRPEKN